MSTTVATRNATLDDLVAILKDQQARALDVVAPATSIRSRDGVLHIADTEPQLGEDGVTMTAGRYRPTAIADEGIAEKLGIPIAYLRRLRTQRPDLYDGNVNGLLHGRSRRRADGSSDMTHEPDSRSFLVRCFRGDEGEEGVARAVLSDRYGIVDNLDVLTAALAGIRAADVNVQIEGCDLTDRRMYVRVVSPQVTAMAPTLLAGYRNPFDDPEIEAQRNGGWTLEQARAAAGREGLGHDPGAEPIVFAGWVLSNSETGDGAFSITPRITVQVCRNGLTITRDAMRRVHLGSRLDDGVVRWSADTQRKNLELITAQARDAVATFLDRSYLERIVGQIEEDAGRQVRQPEKTVQLVAKKLMFDEATRDGILAHFVRGGQATAGGLVNAITSFAQTIDDADKAFAVESAALRALTVVPA
ncbi:MAG: hypothetical protein HYR62_02080 [Actinobacteria bacterium]|nr:hypothetical protein [Actinomycetota bacterium]MBI3687272.1 hypothetical protein [Actinomycetota bacterium]